MLQNGVAAQKSQQSKNCSTFYYLSFEWTALSLGIRLLPHKMALKEDSTLSGFVAHCKEDSVLVRKDGTLSQL